MMSRNFTPEQTLIDRLLLDDTAAFEELARRYCFSLYSYCISKGNSSDEARRIVRNIFISLWEDRHSLPLNFSISLHLYTQVRKSVVQSLNNKLKNDADTENIENKVIPGFRASMLQQARQPAKSGTYSISNYLDSDRKGKKYEELWWNKYAPGIDLENLRRAFKTMLNAL